MKHRIILILATLAAYWNSLSAALPFDSVALAKDDPRVQAWTWHNLAAIFGLNYWGTRFASGLYRPFVTLTFLAQHGSKPWAYHAVNLGLHLLAVMLVYQAAAAVMDSECGCIDCGWWQKRRHISFFTALIWAVHPINTEAVTNVAGRPDLIAAICVLGALLLYMRSAPEPWILWPGEAWVKTWNLAPLGVGILALIGVFSKESAVVILPLCLLYDWFKGRTSESPVIGGPMIRVMRLGSLHLPVLAPIGFMILVRFGLSIFCGMAKPFVDNPIVGASFLTGKLTAIAVLGKLIGLWFWPATLSADYSYGVVTLSHEWMPAAAIAISLIPLIWTGWKFSRTASFWLAFTAICLLPTSNLFVLSGSIMAERFMYLPGVGLAALVAYGLSKFPGKETATVGVVIAIVLATRTVERNRDYRDDLTFWKATVAAAPESFKAHTQLAGEYAKRHDLPAAIAEADAAVKILDTLPPERNAYEPYAEFFNYYMAAGNVTAAHHMGDQVAAIFNALPKCKRSCQ